MLAGRPVVESGGGPKAEPPAGASIGAEAVGPATPGKARPLGGRVAGAGATSPA
jgi:hypothetical protein